MWEDELSYRWRERWDWSNLTWTECEKSLRSSESDGLVIVLPVGSLEQHGPHLPFHVDTTLCVAVCRGAADRLAEDGAGKPLALVLPPVWCTVSPHHMSFAGSLTLTPTTFRSVLVDIVSSIVHHGCSRILIVNGHGGNIHHVNYIAHELGSRHPQKSISALTYFDLITASEWPELMKSERDAGHAGEFETSMMLHVTPSAVRKDLAKAQPRVERTGRPMATSSFVALESVNRRGYFRDPSLGNAAQGRLAYEHLTKRLASVVTEISRAPLGESRPDNEQRPSSR